jgi:phosphatidate phosphatase APP1
VRSASGGFHLREIRLSPLSRKFWEDLTTMVTEGAHAPAFSHKVQRISEIMEHFKERHFILIGDSGEQDPEVYAEIRKRYSTRVQEIRIRDVGNGGARLDGMTVIPAK